MITGGRWVVAALASMAGMAIQMQQAGLSGRAGYALAGLGGAGCMLASFALGNDTPAFGRAAPRDRLRPRAVARPGGRGGVGFITAVKFLLFALGGAALGWGWAGGLAEHRLATQLDPGVVGRDILLTGTVAELPIQREGAQLFRFEIEAARDAHGPVSGLPPVVSLYLPASNGGAKPGAGQAGAGEAEADATDAEADDRALPAPLGRPQRGIHLEAGQRWQFAARLEPPVGVRNPWGQDLEQSAFEQGVLARGKVRPQPPPERLAGEGGHPIEAWRGRVRQAIQAQVDDTRAAGVLAGLVLGDQTSIDAADWGIFRRTGTAHLMAVSGAHVTMFAWLVQRLVRRLWSRWPRAVGRLDAGSAARWAGLGAACLYALFAGWGLPAQRTVAMLGLVTLLRQRATAWPGLVVAVSAAWCVSLGDPWALLNAGFWLSFVAVALLMLEAPQTASGRGSARRPGWRGALVRAAAEGGRTQWRASLGLAPLSLMLFHQVSTLGFVANLVAIPWVGLVLTPLALMGTLVPALWTLAAWGVQIMGQVLAGLAAWPAAVWSAPAAPGWAQALGLLAAMLALAPVPWRLRALAVPLVMPLLFAGTPRPVSGQFEMWAVDVGQGTAVLVRTSAHTLLFDTGPAAEAERDAGHRILVPLLTALGERGLDMLVLSHGDADHVGGAAAVLQSLPVQEVRHALPSSHPLQAELRRAGRREACRAGDAWTWDGVRFEVFHPGPRETARAESGRLGPNGVACVLRVSTPDRSALLTADIEGEQEWALVQRWGAALRSDILVVPHHGSRTSSTELFLRTVQPKLALIQSGWRNRYGHPHAYILSRYDALGIPVLASPACGAWIGDSAGHDQCWRVARRRYWHTAFDPSSLGGLELAKSP